MTSLQSLSLTDFRSYECLDLDLDGQSLYLYGPNGAGKTNCLEAISLLTPGKGLRNAAGGDLGRRKPDEASGRLWGVAATITSPDGPVRLGTGADPRDPSRRLVHIDGEALPSTRLVEWVRLVWMTPAQDRLFIESRSERLRFFDRLVYAGYPAHAGWVSRYEKALRERLRLLTEGPDDPIWLEGLEDRLAETGHEVTHARLKAVSAIQAEINQRQSAFPKADIALTGTGLDRNELKAGFRASRRRDQDARRSLFGPHRADISVIHRDKQRPAAEGSTGEQKALLLNLILAQAARLRRSHEVPVTQAGVILLLDEVAAHLDPLRRHALFDETYALGLQTVFTGTDQSLFEGLAGRALGARVEAGQPFEFTE